MKRSASPDSSSSDDDPYDNLTKPSAVISDPRKVELFYFKPECIPDNFSAVLYGQRRSGKTTWLTWFLYCLRGKVDHVVCFSGTNFTGHYQQFMNPDFCYDEYNEDILAAVLNIQANTPPNKRKRVLVILDDVLDQIDVIRKSRALRTLFTMGRHYGIAIVVTTQHATAIPPSWRRNVDFAVIFYQMSCDNMDIFKNEYGGLVSKNQFDAILRASCDEYRALVVRPCTRSKDIRDVYQLTEAMPHKKFWIGKKKADSSGTLKISEVE
jgi:hypothetical protein